MKWKIIVVPHTHWDKEWYFSKEESDTLLLKNLQDITNILTDDKRYKAFNFDGQSSILDDYFKYKKNNNIIKLLKSKRLIVGPWYTQPDLFNITSESVVRNLLIGIKTVEDMGGKYLKVGYAPDSFGHNAQMPQIYKGFDLTSAIFWRGLSKKQYDENGTLFNWEGIDGTKIKTYNFYNGYWALGAFFPYTINDKDNIEEEAWSFLKKSKEIVDNLKKQIHQKGILLIPLGGDQGPINKLTPSFFECVNKMTDDNWMLGTYEDFFNKINKETYVLGNNYGELKWPFIARVHKTIGSMRYDIKKILKTVEYKLYNQLEPLAVYGNFLGIEYPKELILEALKKILISQAHDSAGGCNSDKTNANIKNRLNRAEDLIDSQITFILKTLSHNLKMDDEDFLLFNTDLNNIKKIHSVKLFTNKKDIEIFDHSNQSIKFEIIKKTIHDGGQWSIPTIDGETSVPLEMFFEYEINIYDDIESLQFKNYKIKEGKEYFINETNENKIENNYFKLEIDKDTGEISLLDKLKNIKLKNIFNLSAVEDNGDSYDYSPFGKTIKNINKLKDFSYSILKNKYSQTIKINYIHCIPLSINSKINVEQPIKLILEINDTNKIDLKINITNIAKNIKWMINNYLDNDIEITTANQAFHTIKRNSLIEETNLWKENGWKEYPVPIETFESFVSNIGNSAITMTWLSLGNNEYEAVKNNLKITLFRSVDVLGRSNLEWRPGRASGTSETIIPTPDATLFNDELNFEFKIIFDDDISLWKEAKDFTTKSIYYQNQKLNNLCFKSDRFMLNYLPEFSFDELKIKCSDENFIFTCLKKCEKNNSYIIRGFNSIEKNINVSFEINNIKKLIDVLNLNEEFKFKSDNILELKPFEILTFRLEL